MRLWGEWRSCLLFQMFTSHRHLHHLATEGLPNLWLSISTALLILQPNHSVATLNALPNHIYKRCPAYQWHSELKQGAASTRADINVQLLWWQLSKRKKWMQSDEWCKFVDTDSGWWDYQSWGKFGITLCSFSSLTWVLQQKQMSIQ